MEASLRNKLLQHEVAPPAAVWEKISMRLDEEFISSDAVLSAKMENASIVPPFNAWDNIAAKLHPQRTKVVPLYRRVAVAAVIVSLIALSAIYFFSNNTELERSSNTVVVNNNNAGAVPAPPARIQSPDTGTQPTKTSFTAARTKKSVLAKNTSSARIATQHEPPYLTYAELEMEPAPVQTALDIQPIEVEAPPIRDALGNIIMDYSVISKPNDPYITITSPSGIQTRISSKFLHCLSYLNGDFSSGEINYEGRQWKNRFEEWRNKLLSEGAFVPAANNFFDIFELKELIEEQ
jgi:hypothetical protein